jgi:hypothetical protein
MLGQVVRCQCERRCESGKGRADQRALCHVSDDDRIGVPSYLERPQSDVQKVEELN